MVNHSMTIFNFRLELVERLLKEGHQVVVSSPYDERIEELKAMGCEYSSVELSRHGMNPIEELKLLKSYKKQLKEIKPDVVLTFTIKPNIYGAMACKSQKIPCIANITGLGTAVENGGLSQFITVNLYKIAYKGIKRVFFQNEENMKFFSDRKIAVKQHALLPGSGVNLSKFTLMDYPSNDENISFVFISRIMKEKGIDQYLDAATEIKKKYPNTSFHICGFCEQAYEDKLNELNDNGTIIYHGLVKDVREVIKNCHCTVHPTYYPEGMSNVLLESAACGRALITTDRSGCREVIDDGINGFIVKQKDSGDLIEKIEKFIALTYDEKRQMGLNGRAKVEKEFDRQIVVEKYLMEIK